MKTYFYHSDHLGSTGFVTDADAKPVQHLQYLPFGELFVSQMAGSFDSPYKFTGKERDEETAYDYFGARYYDSDLCQWLSVDPMSDKRPNLSPYNYCQWNPIGRIDPNGALDDGYKDLFGNYQWFDNEHSNIIIKDNKLWIKVSDNKTIFEMVKFGMFNNMPTSNDNSGEIKPYVPNVFNYFENYLSTPSTTTSEASSKFVLGIVYGTADDIMVYGTNFIFGTYGARHLDNSAANRTEILNAGLNTISTFFPVGTFGDGLGIAKKTVNAAQFGTMFKGESVLRGSSQMRGFNILKYNNTIRLNNAFNRIYPVFNYSPLLLNSKSNTKLNNGSYN